MKALISLLIALSMLALFASCRATVQTGSPVTPSGPVDRHPTVMPLVGDIPVGRWACFEADVDWNRLKTANTLRNYNPYCFADIYLNNVNIDLDRIVEFRPDQTGWVVAAYEPDDSRIRDTDFRIPGSMRLYRHLDDFRWSLVGDLLTTQDKTERLFTVWESRSDVFFIDRRGRSRVDPVMMVAVGSDLYIQVIAFANCVRSNDGRKIFEVVECDVPALLPSLPSGL